MFADTDRDRLRIPFGHELKTGDIMHLDIKEGAEFGAGPHGMLIGTTGSGKSEHLRTLILSLAATHHPRPGQPAAHRLQGRFDVPGDGETAAHRGGCHQHGRGSRARQPHGRGADRRAGPAGNPSCVKRASRSAPPVRSSGVAEYERAPGARRGLTAAANAFRRRRRVRGVAAEPPGLHPVCSTGSAASADRCACTCCWLPSR